MKRIVLLSVAAIFAVIGSACERHPATKLPEHYQQFGWQCDTPEYYWPV